MTQPVTTAIVAASGFNTRRLPAAAAFPKEFMPIGNRPAIDFVVDDLVRAGITDIYIVIHPFHRELFERYFIKNKVLDDHLTRKGKAAAFKQMQDRRQQATFHFIEDRTKEDGFYGSTMPLRVALAAIDAPAFIYTSADDFTFRTDGGSDMADMVAAFHRTSAEAAILGLKRPLEDLKNFGVLAVKPEDNRLLSHLVEKPPRPEELPEPRLANISKYLFTEAVRPFVMESQPNPQRGEYEITDVIDTFAAEHAIAVCAAEGTYYDVGTLDNWLAANQALAKL